MALNVVLHEPEIPQNTGNIARTCAAVGARLHLIRPLGFSTASRDLKRAGLDYWHLVDVRYYNDMAEFLARFGTHQIVYVSTKAPISHTEMRYREECCLVFGKETAGLPEPLLRANAESCVRIPMRDGVRSLNLANSAAILVYEALRQLGFPGLRSTGNLLRDGPRALMPSLTPDDESE